MKIKIVLVFLFLVTGVNYLTAQEDKLYSVISKADSAYDAKNYEESIKLYSILIESYPDSVMYYRRRGFSFHNLNRFDEAKKDYLKAIELGANAYNPYVNLANIYILEENYIKAFELTDYAITAFGENDELLYHRAVSLFNTEKYEQSKQDFIKVIKLAPDKKSPYNYLGNIYREEENYDEAIKSYLKAIELDPAYEIAYFNLGNVYLDLEKYDSAVNNYTKAINLGFVKAEAYEARGMAYLLNLNYPKAIIDFSYLINTGKANAFRYKNLAEVYYYSNKNSEAVVYYTKAIELDNKYAEAYSGRGKAYDDLKENEKSIADHNTAVNLEPDDIEILSERALFYVRHNSIPLGKIDYKKVVELCSVKLKSKPKSLFLLTSRATGYFYLDKYDEAMADCNEVLKIDPSDAIVTPIIREINKFRSK